MPYPDSYTRGFGFEGFQDSHPATPLPGTQVDVELDNASKSTAALVAFLKKLTRADGKLANGSVGVDQLAADFSVGFKAPTTWEPGIAYVESDTVFQGTGFYNCVIAHTSGATFESANWSLIIDFGSSALAAAASAAAAAASATQAATVDGMFSAPVLSISATPAGSPSIGDRYLVAASGTSGVFVGKENQVAQWSGSSWVFSGAPKSGQMLFNSGLGYGYRFDGASWLKRNSRLAYVSDFSTLSACLTFAAAAGARVIFDDDRTLLANTTVSTSIKAFTFGGGQLTLGNFDFIGAGQWLYAGAEKIFNVTGTGRVKGTFFIDAWRPEHYAGSLLAATEAASDALATATGVALDLILRHAEQSTSPGTPIQLQSNYYSTDREHNYSKIYEQGDFPTLRGMGANNTRFYGTSDSLHVWVISTTTPSAGFKKPLTEDISLIGNSTSAVAVLENRGVCFVYPHRTRFSRALEGYSLHNYAAGTYVEHSRPKSCMFDGNCQPIKMRVTSGTGSFNGWGAEDTIWSRITGGPLYFFDWDSATFPYNGWVSGTMMWNLSTGETAQMFKNRTTNVTWAAGAMYFEMDDASPINATGLTEPVIYWEGPTRALGGMFSHGNLVYAKHTRVATGPSNRFQDVYIAQRKFVPTAGDNDIPELIVNETREVEVEVFRSGVLVYMARLSVFKNDSANGADVKVLHEKAFTGTAPVFSVPYSDGTVRISHASFNSSTQILFSARYNGMLLA